MKTFFLSLFLLTFLVPGVSAQSAGKITGRLLKDEKPFAGATVALFRPKDSATIKLSATNKEGVFEFDNIPYGKYIILTSAVGYKKTRSSVIELETNNAVFNLPAINLTALPQNLSGVTVTATRPLIEQKIDRTIVNVEASVTNIGSTALEILEKSPGVNVDKEGNISLKGKDGVLVTIDGRPTQLSGADLANFLRNMNSNQMDQVEIMTNPPARYDAAGNAGVINIKTKKNKAMGYNGTLSLGYIQGRYPKGNEGFNFNYREGKVNLFSNLSHNWRKTFETLTIQRNLLDDNTTQLENYFDQRGDKIARSGSYSAKAGIDFAATKKTTYGLMLTAMAGPNSVNNKNRTEIFNPFKELETTTLATVNNKSNWQNLGANFNFRSLLDKKGRELSAEIDYMNYKLRTNQFMENAIYDAAGNLTRNPDTLLGSLPQNIEVYSGRADYVHPLNKTSRFEGGVKISIVRTDNNANYDSIQNGVIVHDYTRSNHFIYEENINAAYVNLNTAFSKKIAAQFGLRLENTVAQGNQLTTGQGFERDYTSLFPTAYLQYKADEKNNFVLNYGRRIRRPDYGSLNPFIRFIDRYTYNKGNPNLKPQYSDNIELSYSYKNFLTATLNYSAINDIIQSVIEQQGPEAYQTIQNIATMRQYGLAVNFNKQMNKWWTNNINVNLFNNNFKGIVNTAPIDFKNTSLMLNGTQQFKLNKTLTAELNGKYRSATIMGVLRAKPMGIIAAGLSQQVLKNQGSVRVTVRDIFYTQRMKAIIRYGNVDASFQEINDSRVVAFSFSYKFSKGKSGPQKRRTAGSASEESERIGVDQ